MTVQRKYREEIGMSAARIMKFCFYVGTRYTALPDVPIWQYIGFFPNFSFVVLFSNYSNHDLKLENYKEFSWNALF